MKKFIQHLLYFTLPIVLTIGAFEIYLRRIDTTYTEKEKGILQHPKKIEVLILGNSRPTLGIDPNQFEWYAYNLANVAQPFYYDKRIALKYLDQLSNLKYVFITVDCGSLNYSRMNSREIWSYYGNGIEYKNEMTFLPKYSYLNGYSTSIALKLLKNDLSGKYDVIKAIDLDTEYDLNKPIIKGFFGYKGTRAEGLSSAHIFKRAGKGLDVGISSENEEITKDLEEFIRILKAKNITPILLTMPCHKDYVKVLNKNMVKRAEGNYQMLAQKYQFEYWNYLNFQMERNDFHDCDHLNIKGAIKFSKVLNGRLVGKVKKK
jgi:vacuolar-type H+-ATPase subunit F/Vma7